MIVMKFGGTSVEDAKAIERTAAIVKGRLSQKPVVVVSAMAKVTENMGGPVAEEFALTLSEIRIGESRVEALKKFAERAGTPEISSFARSIIQADQFGISLGRILRVQASESRLRRQAAAEERAMKAPIKMLFPTVMFIFPAMFVVTLGPAFLQIRKVL